MADNFSSLLHVADAFYYIEHNRIMVDAVQHIRYDVYIDQSADIVFDGLYFSFASEDIGNTVFMSFEEATTALQLRTCTSIQISNCPTYVSSCQKSSIPTDEEFAAIIEQSNLRAFDTLLSPEDIFIFNIKLCNNDVDSHGEIFTEDCLKQLAELFVGKSSEDGFAVLSCKVECFEDMTTKLGDTYSELIARAYMIRNTKNQHMISKIESKEIQHVRLGLSMSHVACNICNDNTEQCIHIPGKVYDGKLCCKELSDPVEVYEFSLVST